MPTEPDLTSLQKEPTSTDIKLDERAKQDLKISVTERITFANSSLDSDLGSDRKIRVPKMPQNDDLIIESGGENRYRLQGVAQALLADSDKRLYGCLRRLRPGAQLVEVRRNVDQARSHFRNLELCNRVWVCPVCSARISNHRREELTNALAAAKLLGLYPVLVTYTLRHDYRDTLATLLDGLLASLRLFKSGRAWQEIKAEYGVVGGIRVLEPTYGENGWHPHVHEILFLQYKLVPLQIAGLRKWLIDRWLGCLRKNDFDASYAHGLDVRTADSKIADYVAKFGREPGEMEWGIEHEIANAASKKSGPESLTPFQLLESHDYGDKRAGALYVEYAAAMSDKRQLRWSPGLRALLKLPDEIDDEQLPGFEETETVYTAVEIDPANWYKCCMFDIRGAILYLVAAGDWTTLRALFKRYGIKAAIAEAPAPVDALSMSHPPAPVDKSPPVKQIALFEQDQTYRR